MSIEEKKDIKEKGTSVSANSLIWFGIGVSIAEILAGAYLAPLGSGKGLATIVLGHVIGCTLLFMAGLISEYTRHSSMETVKTNFGQKGNLLFCGLNVLQLMGWTSIMIYGGGLAVNGIFDVSLWVWYLMIGGLVLVWLLTGIRNLGKINTAAMAALFVLTLILCRIIFAGNGEPSVEADSSLSFGAAVKLSMVMPLFWLPLISDYIREVERPLRTAAASALVYGLMSCFMYIIGIGTVTYTGEYDISAIVIEAELRAAELLIIVLSIVITTFLDAYSAGTSSVSITHRIKEKWTTVAVTFADTAVAMVYPMDSTTGFLYLTSSVFAPMIAIQVADYFTVRQDHKAEEANLPNLLIWLAGFVIYRILMWADTPAGSTFPDIAATVVLYVVYHRAISVCYALPGRGNMAKV